MIDLTAFNPPTIAALGKFFKDAAKVNRPNLKPGAYDVDVEVLAQVSATVTVGKNYTQRFVNKAQPWNIIYVLLEQLNTERAAAGKVGIDMAALVKMAAALDPKLAEKAKMDAEAEAEKLKAPTKRPANGKVIIRGGLKGATL